MREGGQERRTGTISKWAGSERPDVIEGEMWEYKFPASICQRHFPSQPATSHSTFLSSLLCILTTPAWASERPAWCPYLLPASPWPAPHPSSGALPAFMVVLVDRGPELHPSPHPCGGLVHRWLLRPRPSSWAARWVVVPVDPRWLELGSSATRGEPCRTWMIVWPTTSRRWGTWNWPIRSWSRRSWWLWRKGGPKQETTPSMSPSSRTYAER